MSGVRPEEAVRFPMLRQRWAHVSFVHWRYDPAVVRELLPDGVEVDTFDGAGWVTLTPFLVTGSRPVATPAVPRVSTFPETNLRTYVIGPDGRDGLWFFTLEADSLTTVVAARGLGVPYRWARMRVDHRGDEWSYRGCRRLGRPVAHRIVVRPGHPLEHADCGPAAWLTGRWRAWTRIAGRLAAVPAVHQPWPLADAALVDLQEDLVTSAGLPPPAEAPLVHFSRGVDVRLGWPRFAASPDAAAGRWVVRSGGGDAGI